MILKFFMNLFKRFTSGLPATTVENQKLQPLKLDLQFFADDPPPGDNPPADDPPPSDDDELTLADLLKTNPKIKSEYKTKVEGAIMKRFKDIDPEEARVAIAEKRQRDADKAAGKTEENPALKVLEAKVPKLEKRAKTLAVALHAENKEQAKLITRLAGDKIDALKLNDEYEVDSEEIEEIISDLRDEFPSLFAETQTPPAGGDNPPPPPPKRKPGTNQQLNDPPGSNTDAKDLVKENLRKLGKIK